MAEPTTHPESGNIIRVARVALVAGVLITGFKFFIFYITNSVAVFSDALESVVNVLAASVMLISLMVSHQPADRAHPYGHGKVEFLAVAFEGGLILLAGVVIFYEAGKRLVQQEATPDLAFGLQLVAVATVLTLALAGYVWWQGRRYDNDVLRADAQHLLIDAGSTLAILIAMLIMRWTGWHWLDAVVAIGFGLFALWVSQHLLRKAYDGLMDRIDPEDENMIVDVLDQAVTDGRIKGYHKVRHRHSGPFHWVDMHLQIDPDLSVYEGHERASKIERDIESALGQANATAHVEPFDPAEAKDHGPSPAATVDDLNKPKNNPAS